MVFKSIVFVCLLFLYVVAVKSIPASSNLSGVNKHITNGKAKADIRNAAVVKNAKTSRLEYPEQIVVDLSIDGEGSTRQMNAKKIASQKSPLKVKDMNGKVFQSKQQGAALYTSDDGVVGLIADDNADGTSRTRVASRSKKNNRICYTNDDKSSCWTVDESGMDNEGNVENQLYGALGKMDGSRKKRAQKPIPTVDEYDASFVVEMALVVDQAWMDIFRSRNGDDEEAAVEDASLYMTMLMAEMNHVFRSVGEQSKRNDDIPDFELLIHGIMMIYPPRGLEYSFVVLTDAMVMYGEDNSQDRFVRWVSQQYDTLLDMNFDHVAFITSRQFENGLLGRVTRIGGMCWPWSPLFVQGAISMNSDTQFDILITLAHELLHSLGVVHDHLTECDGYKYVMSAYWVQPEPETRYKFMKFSKCSVRALYEYINIMRTYARDCLAESTNSAAWTNQFCIGSGRGEIADIDFQCQRLFNDSSFQTCSPNIKRVSGQKLVPARACWDDKRIVCGPPSPNKCNKYYMWSVTDGTPCYKGADTYNRICHRGECRPKVDVCGSVDGLTTETIAVKELPCRCHKLKGIPKQECCKNKRRDDNSCCPGCEKRGWSCVVKKWGDNY